MEEKLTLEQMLSQATGDPTMPVPPAVSEEPTEVEEPTEPTEPTEPEEPTEVEEPTEPKATTKKTTEKPNPMKEVRDKLNVEKATREKVEGIITKFTEGDYNFKLRDFKTESGKVDYDAIAEAMEEADIKAKAEKKGISPEVQAEIERIERERTELEKEKLRVSMDRALTTMQQDMNLKSVDINNFFKDAMAVQKNPYRWISQGGDLKDLYRNIYWDKLVKEQVEKGVSEAKTKWESESAKANKIPAANPAQAKSQAPASNAGGISMEELLTQAASKKR